MGTCVRRRLASEPQAAGPIVERAGVEGPATLSGHGFERRTGGRLRLDEVNLRRGKGALRCVGESPEMGSAIYDQTRLVAELSKMPEATVRGVEPVLAMARDPIGRQSHQFLDQAGNHCRGRYQPADIS